MRPQTKATQRRMAADRPHFATLSSCYHTSKSHVALRKCLRYDATRCRDPFVTRPGKEQQGIRDEFLFHCSAHEVGSWSKFAC